MWPAQIAWPIVILYDRTCAIFFGRRLLGYLETNFQTEFRKDLENLFPGCIVCKLDSGYRQGVPDLVMFWGDAWATFEVKLSKDAKRQPNQPYFVYLMNMMSFSAFVYPENKKEILDAVQQALELRG